MTDRPIIFSGNMIRALIDGRKTMTRRLAWRDCPDCPGIAKCQRCKGRGAIATSWQKVKPGDRLWVREAWRSSYSTSYFDERLGRVPRPSDYDPKTTAIEYLADDDTQLNGKQWPSIHMPRWASRLTLTVMATKIERLQDIGWKDAIAEGLLRGDPLPQVPDSHGTIWHDGVTDPIDGWTRDPTAAFQTLWQAIHGPDSWHANPEVVAIAFKPELRNIDAEARAA